MRTVQAAEVNYHSVTNRYGELGDLGEADLTANDLSLGASSGYLFSIRLNAAGYTITAVPLNNHDPSFLSDETLVVRYAYGSEPANVTSPILR